VDLLFLIKRKQKKKYFLYKEAVLILEERKKNAQRVGDDANETKVYKREKKDKYEKN
jgi:hypothetical protein